MSRTRHAYRHPDHCKGNDLMQDRSMSVAQLQLRSDYERIDYEISQQMDSHLRSAMEESDPQVQLFDSTSLSASSQEVGTVKSDLELLCVCWQGSHLPY
jgi:hypothetical protein